MTAVEWLEQKIDGTINTMPSGNRLLVKKVLRQAKEMEKHQIMDAWNDGNNQYSGIGDSETYYETFKNK